MLIPISSQALRNTRSRMVWLTSMIFSHVRRKHFLLFDWCKLRSLRKMTTVSGTDHLNRTANNTRHEILATAEVKEVQKLSESVKMLKLYVEDKQFTFKAGQWVDMFIPGVDTVGGFSMCSAPDLLKRSGILHLAIKFSKHPPAFWVHTKCRVGDHVQLKAGGDFYYDPQPNTEHSDLMLLAGGVGINPLFSMLQHFLYLHPGKDSKSTGLGAKRVSILYSARNIEELIFKEELIEISQRFDNVNLKMFSTREATENIQHTQSRRIQQEDIKSALSTLDKTKTEVFVCGPLSFIKTMEFLCHDCGISKDKVYYENWY